jgi:hypothetical protein
MKRKSEPPPANVIRFNRISNDRPTQAQIRRMFTQIQALITAGDHKALRSLIALADFLADAGNTPPEAS